MSLPVGISPKGKTEEDSEPVSSVLCVVEISVIVHGVGRIRSIEVSLISGHEVVELYNLLSCNSL